MSFPVRLVAELALVWLLLQTWTTTCAELRIEGSLRLHDHSNDNATELYMDGNGALKMASGNVVMDAIHVDPLSIPWCGRAPNCTARNRQPCEAGVTAPNQCGGCVVGSQALLDVADRCTPRRCYDSAKLEAMIEAEAVLRLDASNHSSMEYPTTGDPVNEWKSYTQSTGTIIYTPVSTAPTYETDANGPYVKMPLSGCLTTPSGPLLAGQQAYTIIATFATLDTGHALLFEQFTGATGGRAALMMYARKLYFSGQSRDLSTNQIVNYAPGIPTEQVHSIAVNLTEHVALSSTVAAPLDYRPVFTTEIANPQRDLSVEAGESRVGCKVSGNEQLDGGIREIIVLGRALETDELEDMHHYMASKWGTVSSFC